MDKQTKMYFSIYDILIIIKFEAAQTTAMEFSINESTEEESSNEKEGTDEEKETEENITGTIKKPA